MKKLAVLARRTKGVFLAALGLILGHQMLFPVVRASFARRGLGFVPLGFSQVKSLNFGPTVGVATRDSQTTRVCVAFLVVGSQLSDFLTNSLRSLRSVEPNVPVFLFVEAGLEEDYSELVDAWNVTTLVAPIGKGMLSEGYKNFGSRHFNYICSLKWQVFLELFDRGFEVVIYSDVDIAFMGPFVSYIESVSFDFPVGMQSEGQSTFPSLLCAGFMFFCSGSREEILEFQRLSTETGFALNDQEIINAKLLVDERFRKSVYELPSHLFANGLFVHSLRETSTAVSTARSTCLVFHANFVSGIEKKRELLSEVGLWNP